MKRKRQALNDAPTRNAMGRFAWVGEIAAAKVQSARPLVLTTLSRQPSASRNEALLHMLAWSLLTRAAAHDRVARKSPWEPTVAKAISFTSG